MSKPNAIVVLTPEFIEELLCEANLISHGATVHSIKQDPTTGDVQVFVCGEYMACNMPLEGQVPVVTRQVRRVQYLSEFLPSLLASHLQKLVSGRLVKSDTV